MYLPSSSHPALKEFTGFRDGRAVGVQFVRNKNMDPDVSTDITTVRASRLVVVSAGALGSPAILERSGIGARDLLEKLGINAIVDLPGVGESYQGETTLFHLPSFDNNDIRSRP